MRILVRVRGWQEMTPRSWLVAGPTKIPDDAVFAIKYLLIRAKMPDNKNVRCQDNMAEIEKLHQESKKCMMTVWKSKKFILKHRLSVT